MTTFYLSVILMSTVDSGLETEGGGLGVAAAEQERLAPGGRVAVARDPPACPLPLGEGDKLFLSQGFEDGQGSLLSLWERVRVRV